MPNKYFFTIIYTVCLATQAMFFSSVAVAEQQNLKAEVIAVIDGKTLFVKSVESAKEYTVQLYGVDCYTLPGSSGDATESFALQAKTMAEKLVAQSKDITVTRLDSSYNPTIGIVHFNELNITLQHQLLNSGLAWVDKKSCKDFRICKTFLSIQDNAKLYGYNIWSSPQAPAE